MSRVRVSHAEQIGRSHGLDATHVHIRRDAFLRPDLSDVVEVATGTVVMTVRHGHADQKAYDISAKDARTLGEALILAAERQERERTNQRKARAEQEAREDAERTKADR